MLRRISASFIVIMLIVFACGCTPTVNYEHTTQTDQETQTATQVTQETTEPQQQEPAISIPLIAVSLPVVTDSVTADDGTVLFQHTYQNISLTVPEPEVADRVIVDFLNRTDAASSESDTICQTAKSAYTPGTAWNPYLNQIVYTPMRLDGDIMSMFGNHVTYQGASHPDYSAVSVTYDLVSGNVLQLTNILEDGASIDTLYTQVIQSLNNQKDEITLYIGFEDMVKDKFSSTNVTSWYFSDSGLCFYFSPYEIAPYASGVIIAEIPYVDLVGTIKDIYFPAEQFITSGTLSVSQYDQSLANQFTQFADVVLSDPGKQLLLFTNEVIYDLRIKISNTDMTAFCDDFTVFAAYGLSANNAAMIEFSPSDANETIQVCYKSNSVYTNFLIFNNEIPELVAAQ